MKNNNGWVQSIDPTTGRVFYANKHTRTTQWEVPEGWQEQQHNEPSCQQQQHSTNTIDTLPDGWEESIDPKTGRTFYINHLERVTTWDRPTASPVPNTSASRPGHDATTPFGEGDYSSLNTITLNRFGSHSKWTDPSKGSRYSNSNATWSSKNKSSEPPQLEFSTVHVPDLLRSQCPQCNAFFTTLKRRHHCRLCGDIFCDACSQGRAVLPLDGDEFDKSVRVCDCCLKDVKRGNYFTWRRYLTPLHLYNAHKHPKSTQDEAADEITIDTVTASLSSLSVDLDAIMCNPENNTENQISIPPGILIAAVAKHLSHRKSAEYAICVLANLVTLGNLMGDDSFALAMYGINSSSNNAQQMKHVKSHNSLISMSSEGSRSDVTMIPTENVDSVLSILEWNGSDSRTIRAQEHAAKVIFYITDPKLIAGVLKRHGLKYDSFDIDTKIDSRPVDIDEVETTENLLKLDVQRAFMAMLDHATSPSSQLLQRWATASLRHLINEDQRQSCFHFSRPTKYQSFTSQLVTTGGITILCSLLASDDCDTRVHAISALEAIVIATREIDMMLNNSSQQFYGIGRGTKADSEIVNAIVANGGCGSVLSHILISSEETVVSKGCEFIFALLSPLLTDPRGSSQALHMCISSASLGIVFESMNDGLNSYRHAALALVVGDSNDSSNEISCLPLLIQILRSPYPSRSIQLQVLAAKCLAAVSLAVLGIAGAGNGGIISIDSPLYQRAKLAIEVMEKERLHELVYQMVTSLTVNTLDPSRTTLNAQLGEAVGLILFSMAVVSGTSALYMISNGAVSELLRAASEPGILEASSAVRGEWASRGLCYLETAAALMIYVCKCPTQNGNFNLGSKMSLDIIFEALESGVVGLASRALKAKVNLQKYDFSYSQVRVKIAVAFLLSSVFEMCYDQVNDNGLAKLYDAIDSDCAISIASNEPIDSRTAQMASTSGRCDLVASTISLLRATVPVVQKVFSENSSLKPLPIVDLFEACLWVVGSICGSKRGCFAAETVVLHEPPPLSDRCILLTRDACKMAFEVLRMNIDQGKLLSAVLVGSLGQTCIVPMLRLILAVVENGSQCRSEIVRIGLFGSVSDILQSSILACNTYIFVVCASIIRLCGPTAMISDSMDEAIKMFSSLLSGGARTSKMKESSYRIFQLESVKTIESISTNEVTPKVMLSVAIPAITKFVPEMIGNPEDEMLCSALKTVLNLVTTPSQAFVVTNSELVRCLVKLIDNSCDSGTNSLGSATSISLHIIHTLSTNGKEIRQALIVHEVLPTIIKLLQIPDISNATSDKHSLATVLELVSNAWNIRNVVREVAENEVFVRRLIATMIDEKQKEANIPIRPIYGSPFSEGTFDLAAKLLLNVTLVSCADENGRSHMADVFRLHNTKCAFPTVAFACCAFLCMLNDDAEGISSKKNSEEAFLSTTKELMMEILAVQLAECVSIDNSKMLGEEMVRFFELPHICLSFCQIESIATTALDLFETLTILFRELVENILLGDKSTLLTLLDIITTSTNRSSHAQTSFARVLGNVAKCGMLSQAVIKFNLRSQAIAALSVAIVLSGSEDGENIIEEDESCLSRILLNCLVSILLNDQDQIEMTGLEARAMASAMAKILSSTVLHRFYIQASRETILDSINHSIDRTNISSSPEARLLCSIATFGEGIDIVSTCGGFEAISLLAHDGEISAIRSLRNACESYPNASIAADAHLSILDVVTNIESKIEGSNGNSTTELRDVLTHCFYILNHLVGIERTRRAIFNAKKSADALTIASYLIVASSKMHMGKRSFDDMNECRTATTFNRENQSIISVTDHNDISLEKLQLDDDSHYAVEETESSNSRLALSDMNRPSLILQTLLSEKDCSLERAALSFMLSSLASKLHREQIINDKSFADAIFAIAKTQSSVLVDFRCEAIELVGSLTKYSICSCDSVAELLIYIIESQLIVLQRSRETAQIVHCKKMAVSAVTGLQNLYTTLHNDLKVKIVGATSDFFVHLVDSLYIGHKARGLVVPFVDGMLLTNLTSLFLLASGSEEVCKTLISRRHISSLLRCIMMASGADSRVVIPTNEVSHYLDAAMEFCLLSLSYIFNETFQKKMEIPLNLLISDVESSQGVFMHCLEHLSSEKLCGGVSHVIAIKLLSEIRSFCHE